MKNLLENIKKIEPMVASQSKAGLNLDQRAEHKEAKNYNDNIICETKKTPTMESQKKQPTGEKKFYDHGSCKEKITLEYANLRSILESNHTIPSLEGSQIKPNFITDTSFERLCTVKASLDLIKNGAKPTDVILLGGLTVGFPGRNFDAMTAVVGRIPVCRGKHNMLSNMPEEIITQLTPKDQKQISEITLAEPARITEYVAMAKVNSNQDAKLVYAKGENPAPYTLSGYHNQTPNARPDYVVYLPQPVGNITAVGFDFKYSLSQYRNQNVVKGCTIDLEKHIEITHTNLVKLLIEQRHKLDLKNRDLAESLKERLHNNLTVLQENKDIDAAILSYNNLRNEFFNFLLENKIGMTLLTHIDKSDFVIDKDTKNAFADRLMDYYSNPNSSLLEFLNKQAEVNFSQMANESHLLIALTKTIYPDK